MLTLINSVENSLHFLYKTVDTDTSLLTNVADQLTGVASLKHHAFNFGTLHEQIDRKNDYITGKLGIGPYALNVTNQELTRLNHVRFAETIVTKNTRISRLDNIVDIDDNPIAAWESGYINGHVDIVKNPFVTVLNVNQFTYNLSNLLTRCGFSDTTLWFLCQPIIKKMAAASNGATGQYTRDGSKGTYSIKEAAIAKACVDATGIDETTLSELLDRIKNPQSKEDRYYIAKCINYIEENADLLKEVAIHTDKFPQIKHFQYKKPGIPGVIDVNVADVQLQVLKAYVALEKYQRALGKLVQYTKIDTKNYGKSLIQTRRYLKIYEELVKPANRKASIFDMSSIDRLIKDTWIEYKTQNAIKLPFQILGGQVFNANESFIKKVLDSADILKSSEDITEQMVDELSKSIITAIKSKYIIEYAKNFEDGSAIKKKTDQDIAKLFTSQNALPKRLNRLLDQIRNNPKYARLANNYLLQSISAEFDEEPIVVGDKFVSRPSFIALSSNVGDNKHNADMFSEAWEDLLNDDDPFVRNFANDLIIYSFLTSGEYNGWTHMFKYVPYNWRVGKTKGFDHKTGTYADFIKRMLAGGLSEVIDQNILDDIVANNFMNNSIIRSSRIVDQDGTVNFATNPKGNIAIGKFEEDIADSPKYITLKKPGTRGKNQDDYRIYKRVGFYKNHPVYGEITKRGYHHKGYDIYEYGWDFDYIENKSTNAGVVYKEDIEQAIQNLKQQQNVEATNDLNKLISIISKETNSVIRDKNDKKDDVIQQGGQQESVLRTVNGTEVENERWITDDGLYLPLDMKEFRVVNKDLGIDWTFNGERPDDSWSMFGNGSMQDVSTGVITGIKGMRLFDPDGTDVTEQYIVNRNQDDGGRMGSDEENKKTLESGNTILSNEELKEWNKAGIGPNPRILVASEHTDPAFHVQEILDVLEGKSNVKQGKKYTQINESEYNTLPNEQRWMKRMPSGNIYYKVEERTPLTGKDFNGLYLITKHDGLPMERLLKTKIPKLIHFSITGLGGTKWEPGVMKSKDLLDRIQEYINIGLDPNIVTVRIDPIIPGVTKKEDIEYIIKRASEMGIKRIRFSVMQIYSDIVPLLNNMGYDMYRYYNKQDIDDLLSGALRARTGQNVVHCMPVMFDGITNFLLEMKAKYGVTLGSCAMPMDKPGISKEGCLSVDAVNRMLGTSIPDRGTENNRSRKECSCFGGKVDMLSYNDKCASHCIYCYAHHQNDKSIEYYDEDGKLRYSAYSHNTNTKYNNGMTNRPTYDFGKVHLTDRDRSHMQESIVIRDKNGNAIKGAESANNIIHKFDDWYNAKTQYVTIPYREWKPLVQVTDWFEDAIQYIQKFARQENYIDEKKHFKYNERNKTVTLDKGFYDFVKSIHDNIDGYELLLDVLNCDYEDLMYTLGYMAGGNISDIYYLFKDDDIDTGEYTIEYSYADVNQRELFSGVEYSQRESLLKQAQEFKKRCTGGK